MPGSVASMAVQKKQSVTPPSQGPLSTQTIESQRKTSRYERTADNIKPNSQAKKMACPVHGTAAQRAAAVANATNIDERLKAARERREEQQRLIASRKVDRLEREQRARQFYEEQLQERKKKVLQQKLKEERRRAAVEEKRNQRLKEEKERHESTVRKTLEKSQRAQQSSQAPRGRNVTKTVPRRLPLSPWEKNLVSRLLTPTCSYLARSKSAACESGEEVSFHSMNSNTTTTTTTITPTTTRTPQKPQHNSSVVYKRPSASPSPSNTPQRRVNLPQVKPTKQPNVNKKISNSGSNTRSPAVKTKVKPAAVTKSRTTSPSPERTPRRSLSRHSTPLQLELPSVPEEDVDVWSPALSPGNSRPARTSAEGQQEKLGKENPPEDSRWNLPDNKTEPGTRTAGDGSPPQTAPPSDQQPPRSSAGTRDPEEASRLLAEKRREARMQREREEQERLQKEEAERRGREELERRRAEERARQQAEAQRLIEEKRRKEEEEQRRAEEERAQAMREAALLQKQREEEQAKERAKAEQLKQERDLLAQKEDAARQARKKRLEEIMRRTRRTDSPDTKSAPVRQNEAQPKENTQPLHSSTIEDVVKLPAVGTKPSQLGLNNQEDMVPVVAFKERRSLRTLTGLEEIQTHQRAEVI